MADLHPNKNGNPHLRIKIETNDQKSLAIRTISKEIFTKKPGFDLLNWIGIRKRVILQVKEGNKTGFVAVNAESLRKRLGITEKEFYEQVKLKNGDITDYIEQKIKNTKLPDNTRWVRGLD